METTIVVMWLAEAGALDALNNGWEMAKPWVINFFTSGTAGIIALTIVRGMINSKFKKIDLKKLFDESNKHYLDYVKDLTIKQDLTPLVKDNLKDFVQELADVNVKYYTVIIEQNKYIMGLIGTFSSYFDDSMAITEAEKAEFKELVAAGKALTAEPLPAPVIETSVTIEQETKPTKHKKKEPKEELTR